eukprot:scaffold287672_cov37-Tisochrysis_lutea.AAC.1
MPAATAIRSHSTLRIQCRPSIQGRQLQGQEAEEQSLCRNAVLCCQEDTQDASMQARPAPPNSKAFPTSIRYLFLLHKRNTIL